MTTKHKGSSTPKRELRTYTAAQPMTVRTKADGSKQIAGYAIVWNSPSVDLGGFTEICSPNMLDRTLKESTDILALRDHRQELLLGRTTAGTLELRTDAKGCAFTITLPKTAIGDDTAENVRVRNLTGVSFGFTCRSDSWSEDSNGNLIRELLDVDLYEISPTSFPAYADTSVSTRSCPANLRKRITVEDIIDSDDDPDLDDPDSTDVSDDESEQDDETCSCPCPSCERDDCSNCEDVACVSTACGSCPMQDDTRTDNWRVRSMFARRMIA